MDIKEVLSTVVSMRKTEYMTSLGASARKYGRPVCSEPLLPRERVRQPTELMIATRAGDTTAIAKHISQLGALCEGKLLAGGELPYNGQSVQDTLKLPGCCWRKWVFLVMMDIALCCEHVKEGPGHDSPFDPLRVGLSWSDPAYSKREYG